VSPGRSEMPKALVAANESKFTSVFWRAKSNARGTQINR
jgi:hypothetical protein